MRHEDKCKLLVVAETSLLRAQYKLEAHGENYADVVHDLYDVVDMLFTLQKDELENTFEYTIKTARDD